MFSGGRDGCTGNEWVNLLNLGAILRNEFLDIFHCINSFQVIAFSIPPENFRKITGYRKINLAYNEFKKLIINIFLKKLSFFCTILIKFQSKQFKQKLSLKNRKTYQYDHDYWLHEEVAIHNNPLRGHSHPKKNANYFRRLN